MTDLTEREKQVVAWLNEQARERGLKFEDGWALHWAADAIERGEHLQGGE